MNQTISLKLIFSDSFQFFAENIRQIASLCLPFLIAGAVFNNVILRPDNPADGSGQVFIYSVMVNLALHPIYTAALIMLMARRAMHHQPTNSQLIVSVIGKYIPFLLLTLIQMGLMWFGFMLLVLPGIWVTVRLAFADFFLVIENLDPRDAIVRSFQTTRRYSFQVLAALALFALPIFMFGIFINESMNTAGANAFFQAAADTVISFAALFLHVILFRIFMQATQDSRKPQVGL